MTPDISKKTAEELAGTVHIRIIQGEDGNYYLCDDDLAPGGFSTIDGAIKFCRKLDCTSKLIKFTVDKGFLAAARGLLCLHQNCEGRSMPSSM